MGSSGTQFNTSVNGVISNRGFQIARTILGGKAPVHANDRLNMSQSSNDSLPTTMRFAAVVQTNERLVPAVTARWEKWHLRPWRRTSEKLVFQPSNIFSACG